MIWDWWMPGSVLVILFFAIVAMYALWKAR